MVTRKGTRQPPAAATPAGGQPAAGLAHKPNTQPAQQASTHLGCSADCACRQCRPQRVPGCEPRLELPRHCRRGKAEQAAARSELCSVCWFWPLQASCGTPAGASAIHPKQAICDLQWHQQRPCPPPTCGGDVHDVAVPLNLHQLLHTNRARLRDLQEGVQQGQPRRELAPAAGTPAHQTFGTVTAVSQGKQSSPCPHHCALRTSACHAQRAPSHSNGAATHQSTASAHLAHTVSTSIGCSAGQICTVCSTGPQVHKDLINSQPSPCCASLSA